MVADFPGANRDDVQDAIQQRTYAALPPEARARRYHATNAGRNRVKGVAVIGRALVPTRKKGMSIG